jgi:hypothetical protein
MGLGYTKVRIFPFVDKITKLEDIDSLEGGYNVDDLPQYTPPDSQSIFCFGAIKLARIASDLGWKPGSMMNSNHDFLVYREYFGENLLNYDSQIIKLGEFSEWKNPNQNKFIRPTADTKSFTGGLFSHSEWVERMEHNLHNFRSDIFNEDTLIQVSTPKEIWQEIRCWVVGGRIITASTYKVGKDVLYKRVIDDDPIKWAQSMVDKFQLNDAFVIDICQTPSGWKIVEFNCINCAGFYDCDIKNLLFSLETHFNDKNPNS